MSIKHSIQLVMVPFIAMMAWGAYGGFRYGWWIPAPIGWSVVAFALALAQSATLFNVFYQALRKDVDPDA
jgi:hypothetical protein